MGYSLKKIQDRLIAFILKSCLNDKFFLFRETFVNDELCIFVQAARHSIGLEGDYLEFGVWKGYSFCTAYFSFIKADEWAKNCGWNIPLRNTRFFAFDSFEGLPEVEGFDKRGFFSKGDYSCSQEDF